MVTEPRSFLCGLLDAAIAAAKPDAILAPHLPPPPAGRTVVLGAGKAAAAMARAVERHMSGPVEGLVVTRYGHAVPCASVEVVEAAHPVPDAAGRAAARRILEYAKSAGADDLVLCLISGGASALLALPADGLALEDKQAVNRALLASGADITQMNAVRKHLSAIKGGRLAAAAHPAKVVSLLISDAPGDDPAVIGSGPTVPDPSTFADALAIFASIASSRPPPSSSICAAKDETPKPGDPRLAHARTIIVARPQVSPRRRRPRARGRDHAGDPRRCPGRRGARGGQGAGRHRAPGAPPRPAGAAALRPPLRRRDHGHDARQRARRPQRRVPAGARHPSERRSRHQRPCRRYRWHRWQRGQRRRHRAAGHARARPREGAGRQRHARRQRRLRVLRRSRRSS